MKKELELLVSGISQGKKVTSHIAVSTKKLLFKIIHKGIRMFDHRKIWLVSDREDAAGDNGEAFFRFLQNKDVVSYFVISKESTDYERMKAIGKVVNARSIVHKILLCSAEVAISSHEQHMRDHEETHQIFLQHGVVNNDISKYINSFVHKNVWMLACSTAERDAYLCGNYRISEKQILLTGLPRYDDLMANGETGSKVIVICLTWRQSIEQKLTKDDFVQTDYFKAYDRLINDKDLLSKLDVAGYKLYIKLHPKMERFSKCFQLAGGVEMYKKSFPEMFQECSLLITDYSSIAFDQAYMLRPVIYYQFDFSTFFKSEHTVKKGYFDYKEYGFGPAVYTYEELADAIIDTIEHDCVMDEIYRQRVQNFFAYRDGKNCERVYEAISKMLEEYRNE